MNIATPAITNCKIFFSVFTLVFTLAGCGGSNKSLAIPVIVDKPVEPAPLSEDQRIFESTFLASKGGAYDISWPNGDVLTITPKEALDYFTYSHITLRSSSVAAEQVHFDTKEYRGLDQERDTWDNFHAFLMDGKIIYANTNFSLNNKTIRYEGPRIQLNLLAEDNLTIVQSMYLENFRIYPLTGNIASTVIIEEDSNLVGLLKFANLRNPNRTYLPNSQAVTYTTRLVKDTYVILDCDAFFNGENKRVSPCPIKTTLQSALTAGIDYLGRTYYAADGIISQVSGKNVWIALQPRTDFDIYPKPIEDIFTFFFEQDGEIIGGNLTKADQILSGRFAYSPRLKKSIYLNYSTVFNKNGKDSLKQVVLAP